MITVAENRVIQAYRKDTSFADITDTAVYASNEIRKRYAGSINNRNCVR